MRQWSADILALAGMVIGDGPSAVEMQERDGQMEMGQPGQLPTEGLDRELCGRIGIRIIGVVKGDELFTEVVLPEGWEVRPADDSRWTVLVDDRGRERAQMFYKAAFYDRKAHIRFERRFTAHGEPTNGYDSDSFMTDNRVGIVRDCGNEIYRTDEVRHDDPVAGGLRGQAEAWLDERHSDWRDPAAYWSEQ